MKNVRVRVAAGGFGFFLEPKIVEECETEFQPGTLRQLECCVDVFQQKSVGRGGNSLFG